MSDLQAFHVGGKLLYTFDWTLEMPAGGVTISSIDYVLPTGITQFADSDDLVNFKGTGGFQGFAHGGTYQVVAKATLSNQESIPKTLTVRGFNG